MQKYPDGFLAQAGSGWDRPDGYESSTSNPYQVPTQPSRPRSPSASQQEPVRHRKPSQNQGGQPRYQDPRGEYAEAQPRYEAPRQEKPRHGGGGAPLVGTARRPPSFADRLKSAETGVGSATFVKEVKSNLSLQGGGREGPLWGYSNPGVCITRWICRELKRFSDKDFIAACQVRRQLMERSSQQGSRPIDQVVFAIFKV